MKNFERNIWEKLSPGQLVKASSDLYRADPKGSLLVSEGTIGTIIAHEPRESVFGQALKVCFEGKHEWYVSNYEVDLINTSDNEK